MQIMRYLLILTFISSVVLLILKSMPKNLLNNSTLIIGEGVSPFSVDPLDFDLSVHGYIFRFVHMSLVSIHRTSAPVGMLAESWSISQDKKNGFLRSGITYTLIMEKR